MNTLLELITHTKGVEYLIAIAFLFGFLTLWQVLHHRGKGLARKVFPLVVTTMAIGLLATTCAMREPSSTTETLGNGMPLAAASVLADQYGPAPLTHDIHEPFIKNCSVCHHDTEHGITICGDCHAITNTEDLSVPVLSHAYHLQCVGCHEESQMGPTECTDCHTKVDTPPADMAHSVNDSARCLDCHGDGIPGVASVPDDHVKVENGSDVVCELCHEPAEAGLTFLPVPHGDMGSNCLLCHGTSGSGATALPVDHTGRTNETCPVCHKSG